MWKQISLSQALQGFLAGQTVKVVDFEEEEVSNLFDILKRFDDGAAFFVSTSAKEPDIVPSVTESLTAEDLVPTAAAPEPPRVTRAKKQLEETEKVYQSRKISDIGKLKACREAGWSVKKLAEEFGCSEQTVRNSLKQEGIA